MTSRPTNGGPGVAPPDGYTADTGTMSGTARNISNAAEDARGELDDIQATELTEAEFGTKHTRHRAAYAAGIEKLGQSATAMCDSLVTFAGQIGGAGQSYSGTDAGAAHTVTAPRGGQ